MGRTSRSPGTRDTPDTQRPQIQEAKTPYDFEKKTIINWRKLNVQVSLLCALFRRVLPAVERVSADCLRSGRCELCSHHDMREFVVHAVGEFVLRAVCSA